MGSVDWVPVGGLAIASGSNVRDNFTRATPPEIARMTPVMFSLALSGEVEISTVNGSWWSVEVGTPAALITATDPFSTGVAIGAGRSGDVAVSAVDDAGTESPSMSVVAVVADDVEPTASDPVDPDLVDTAAVEEFSGLVAYPPTRLRMPIITMPTNAVARTSVRDR